MGCFLSRDVFIVQDLFAVGLGFDIAGAFLLALGLLVSPLEIARRSSIYTGFNSSLMVSQARDRVDGAIGLAALLVGFILQAVAFALTFGGLGGSARDGGFKRGAVALTMSTLGVAFVLLVWEFLRQRLVARTPSPSRI